jgi:small subunit ribosomal protein S20
LPKKGLSAEKAARTSERKRLRNRSLKSATKTHITRAVKLISSNQLEDADKAVATTISALDRDAKKGVIHRNTAARRKSRLMKKLNRAKTTAEAPATKGKAD